MKYLSIKQKAKNGMFEKKLNVKHKVVLKHGEIKKKKKSYVSYMFGCLASSSVVANSSSIEEFAEFSSCHSICLSVRYIPAIS